MDNKLNPKILFIPGWLDTGARNGFQNSLDVWSKDININQDFKVDYVIAHSGGSLVALYNWQKYHNFKIILVNPAIQRKNGFWHWAEFMIYEGIPREFRQSIKIRQIIPAILKMTKLLKIPVFDIIDSIPRENMLVFYGERDKYLCRRELIKIFQEKGFKVTEVKGAGHNYDPIINKKVFEAIKLNQNL
ncbi:MAG TPA: hypothetical protein VFD16_00735 [Candidatus Saccharimonadales bacterium]|nr:hypothetical protein [Candidatus Saccharimonadales bacterium]